MTRCLYAQLSQQRFEAAPKVFGQRPHPGTQLAKEFDLGAKLALGFEILASRADDAGMSASNDYGGGVEGAATTSTHIPPMSSNGVPPRGARWDAFVAKLRTSGYFRDNIDDSREFKELMASAERFYRDNVLP